MVHRMIEMLNRLSCYRFGTNIVFKTILAKVKQKFSVENMAHFGLVDDSLILIIKQCCSVSMQKIQSYVKFNVSAFSL